MRSGASPSNRSRPRPERLRAMSDPCATMPLRGAGPRVYLFAIAMRTSTRRFFARPLAVSFVATGCFSPRPSAATCFSLTPRSTSTFRTASARRCDSSSLCTVEPVESGEPPPPPPPPPPRRGAPLRQLFGVHRRAGRVGEAGHLDLLVRILRQHVAQRDQLLLRRRLEHVAVGVEEQIVVKLDEDAVHRARRLDVAVLQLLRQTR